MRRATECGLVLSKQGGFLLPKLTTRTVICYEDWRVKELSASTLDDRAAVHSHALIRRVATQAVDARPKEIQVRSWRLEVGPPTLRQSSPIAQA